ncbi:MAG: hypothetical protein M1838_002301 [Thelocarpon superellum]|nr:MAG: hypothetical protein M1838_002301 [Thelocarpon superellum]
MPAPSLLRIAKRTCVRNIKAIVDVGDVPYEVVRDVLIRVENPDQLRQIELVSPQVCGEDAEIWMGYIKRDISGWAEKPHQPKNPKNWYKVYQKLRMESQAEVDRDTSKLRAAMEGRMAEKGKNTSKLVDMADLPGLGKNTQFGRRTRRTAGQGSTLSSSSSTLTFTSGSKTKNVMQKVRREAREMSLFSHQNSKLSQPTHLLNGQSSKVRSAPRGLVDEHRRPAPPIESPKRKAPVVFPPRGMLTKPPTQNPAKNASSGDASKAAEKTPTNAVSQETECRLNEFTSRHFNQDPTHASTIRPTIPNNTYRHGQEGQRSFHTLS